MEKIIWVIGSDKKEMIEAQKRINSTGSMCAFCILSIPALQKSITGLENDTIRSKSLPSLIILDYLMDKENEYAALLMLKRKQVLAGIPLFFMVAHRTEELNEECYAKGATVVLRKPFSYGEILRVERTAWQHDVTKNYEKMLQKQASDLQAAKQIHLLNMQLKSRNELLYQIFGRYFSDEVVEVILDNPEGAVVGGQKREVTIMMSDLRGFTSVSEYLDPDSVTDLLDFYFARMVDVITKYHGIVIEFLGDGILAVFGAHAFSEQQSMDAIAAAIQMQNYMKEVNQFCEKKGYPELEMGIGIHRGEVFVGNVGSEKMMRFNVIGKAVNQCSRIESFSVGGQVLVSKETLDKTDCKVEVRNQMEVTAKGLVKPMLVYEVIEISGDYKCMLDYIVSEKMYPVEVPVTFNMYPIEGKMIMDYCVCAQLVQFSRKKAVVRLEDGSAAELTQYSDVEIFAAGLNGRAIFTNVYAKILEMEQEYITLGFTHVNKRFQGFAGMLLENNED